MSNTKRFASFLATEIQAADDSRNEAKPRGEYCGTGCWDRDGNLLGLFPLPQYPTTGDGTMPEGTFLVAPVYRRLEGVRPAWIPVTRRVPDESIPHGYCLVSDGVNVGTANYDGSRFWLINERDEWTPTHWMPLPSPPGD